MRKGFTLVELIGVIIVLGLIALIALPPILNAIRGKELEISEASKEIIYSAANLYVSDNSNSFPKTNGNTFCVTLDTLVQGDYLPDVVYDAVSGDEVPLTNMVEVKYEQDRFSYNLNNECVEKIIKTELIEILLEQYNPDNTTGLVQDETNSNIYYYTGTNEEVSNNYLWYGGHHWRVVEFDTDANTLLLISQQPLTSIQPASTAWDTKEEYESSYINTWLNEYFYNSLDSSVQNSIISNTFNIGIYTDVDEITTSQKVGLLDEDQYTRAGGADSYLDIKDVYWLGNRYSSSNVRSVSNNGHMSNISPSSSNGARAVIKISDITITGGNGTLESNYEAGNKATNTSDIQVGEYINVPYSGSDNACGDDNKCIFRVVSKDSDSIKVVLNGLLPATSAYGDTTTITTSHTIYTPLNTFVNNISSDYRYTGNKTFYIGDYPSGANYTDIQDETLSANVGLPTVGEMFSGNDIDLSTSSTKRFVNVGTIENPTVSSIYWTMNRYSSSDVRRVNNYGTLNNNSPTDTFGARAVIYLKSGTSALTFTGGEGTAEQPYELQ